MSVCKLLLLLGLSVVTAVSVDGVPPADPDPNRFAKEIEAFAEWDSKNAVPAGPVLFVGSSSIRMWRTHESFPDLPVINRGFGGSHVSDVICFADRVVLPYKPKVIVFYAGNNDIASGKSAEHVFRDYRRFVELVASRLPATRVVFLAINPSPSRWTFWPEGKKANGLIREFCRSGPNLLFADCCGLFIGPDGMPRDELFLEDKLHLNQAGYAVWTAALAPVLRQALEPRSGDVSPVSGSQ